MGDSPKYNECRTRIKQNLVNHSQVYPYFALLRGYANIYKFSDMLWLSQVFVDAQKSIILMAQGREYNVRCNHLLGMNRVRSAGAARPNKGHAKNWLTASSFHSTPVPMALSMIAMPFSIRSGSARMGFHQSAYSSQ